MSEDGVPEQEFRIEGGTFVIHVVDSRTMLADKSAKMAAAMAEVAKRRDVALLALASPDMRNIDAAVPGAWLNRTGDPTYRLRAIAVVTQRSAVKVVATGFAQANKLLRIPLQLQVFANEAQARSWLDGLGFLRPD